MIYKSLKKIIISNNIFRFFDKLLRIIFSIIPLIHANFKFRVNKNQKPDMFVIFINGGIGDCAMRIPMLDILHRYCETLVIIPEHSLELFSSYLPSVDCISYNGNTGILDLIKKIKVLLKKNSIFIFTSSIAEVYMFFIILRIRRGFGLIGNNEYFRSIGLDMDLISITSKAKVDIFKDLACNIIRNIYRADVKPCLTLHKDNETPTQRYVVINPNKTNEWPAGRWSPERFALVADQIFDKYKVNIVFVGTQKERLYVDSVIAKSRNHTLMTNLAGTTTVTQLNILLKNASLVLTNDSGIMHMAALSGAPCLAIFSFSDPNVYSWPGLVYPLFNPEYACMPCVSSSTLPVDNYPFMCPYGSRCDDTITVNQVIMSIESLRERGICDLLRQ